MMRNHGLIAGSAILSVLLLSTSQIARARDLQPTSPASENNRTVQPIDWSKFAAPVPTDAESETLRLILDNSVRYLLNAWWKDKKKYDTQIAAEYINFAKDPQVDLYGNPATSREQRVRPAATQALVLAISLRMGKYNPVTAGATAANARLRAVKLLKSVARSHWVNYSPGLDVVWWGNDWQSALWAYNAGLAAWMLWDDLSVADREYVRRMVEAEANRYIGYQTPYYARPDGIVNYPGDTKAEENSWNASVVHLALSMMPGHPHYRAWQYKDFEMLASVSAAPKNVNEYGVFNGVPLRWWLNGSNILADYTSINHSILHPDYLLPAGTILNTMMPSALADQPAPLATRLNATNIYEVLTDRLFIAGTIVPGTNTASWNRPGGYAANQVWPLGASLQNYVYRRDSSGNPIKDLYFPQGNDWGTMRRSQYVLMDVVAGALGLDAQSSAGRKAPVWEALHADVVLGLQNRAGHVGNTYETVEEDTFFSREESVALNAARAYFVKWMAANNKLNVSNEAIGVVVDNWDRGVLGDPFWAKETADSALGGTNPPNPGLDPAPSGNNLVAYPGTGSTPAMFPFRAPRTATFKVYAWWAADALNATNVSYTVRSDAGAQLVVRNQAQTGGQWVQLGTTGYPFTGGSLYYMDVAPNAGGKVRADAFLFVE